jgi:hypothetical protein
MPKIETLKALSAAYRSHAAKDPQHKELLERHAEEVEKEIKESEESNASKRQVFA